MRKIAPTLKEVATEAGVNVSTASRALSGGYGVHDKTRNRVLAVARRLGYRPNLIARGLVTGRTHTIGLLISDIRNPFFADIARGAEDAAFAASFDVILCNSDLNADKQMRYVYSLVEKKVAGLLMNSVAALSPEERHELAAVGVPIVLLNKPAGSQIFSTVVADNYQGGVLAGEYLVRLGHRVIAHVTGPRNHGNLTARCTGFLAAVRSSNGRVTPIVIHGEHTQQGGYEMTRKLLGRHPEVTAIFAANDSVAYGAISAVLEMGRTIPDDLSLVGFDNIAQSSLIHPPLTTIHQPSYEMGQAAVEILLRQVESKGIRVPEHRLFGVKLIERSSCRVHPPDSLQTASSCGRLGAPNSGPERGVNSL